MATQIFNVAVQQGSRKLHTQGMKVCGVTFEVRGSIATGNEILEYKLQPIGWDRLVGMSTGKAPCGKLFVIEDENARIVFDKNKVHHGKMELTEK